MNRREEGLTLTEVLVSTLLFMFIVAGLFSVVLAANRSWQTYGASVRSSREARKAVMMMTRDLRVAQNLNIAAVVGVGVTVTFDRPGTGNVVYSWSPTGAQANRLIRQTASGSRIVAQHVTALSVVRTGDMVTVDVTGRVAASGSQNVSFRLKQRVNQRL